MSEALPKLSPAVQMVNLQRELSRDQDQYKEIVDEFHQWSNDIGELRDVKMSEFDHLNEQGKRYFAEKKFGEAIESYKKALKIDEQSARIYSNLAACYIETNECNRAIKVCSLGLTLENDAPKLLYRRALAYFELGQYDKSQKDLTRLIQVHGPLSGANLLLKKVLLKLDAEVDLQLPIFDENDKRNEICDESEQVCLQLDKETENYQLNPHDSTSNSDTSSDEQINNLQIGMQENNNTDRLQLSSENILAAILTIENFHRIPVEVFAFIVHELTPEDLERHLLHKLDSNILHRLICIVQFYMTSTNCSECLKFLICLASASRFNLLLNLLVAEHPTVLEVLHYKTRLLKEDIEEDLYRKFLDIYRV